VGAQKAVQENAPVLRKDYCAKPNVNVEEHVMGSQRKLHHLLTNLTVYIII